MLDILNFFDVALCLFKLIIGVTINSEDVQAFVETIMNNVSFDCGDSPITHK